MKEASGELSMTLIVIIAAGVILTIFMIFRKPILDKINSTWSGFFEQGDTANQQTNQDAGTILK